MLAFALDITQNKPKSSKESDNDELKQYMDYQRKLNHENLVKHSLEFVKNQLEENIESSDDAKPSQFLKTIFPISMAQSLPLHSSKVIFSPLTIFFTFERSNI